MPQYRATVQLGKTELADVAIAAGSAEAQSDTVSVNLDVTNMSKADAMHLIDEIQQKLHASPWPPL